MKGDAYVLGDEARKQCHFIWKALIIGTINEGKFIYVVYPFCGYFTRILRRSEIFLYFSGTNCQTLSPAYLETPNALR